MARTAIDAGSIISIAGPQLLAVSPGAADIVFDAADDVNGNEFQSTGNEIVLVSNPTGGALSVTFTAAPDSIGRAGSISSYSIAAGEIAVFGPFATTQWRQADGMVYIDTSATGLEIAVFRP